jgi:hypothetical protein
MAWSPARRASTGLVRVGQPGDYATPNSNQPRDGTTPDIVGFLLFDGTGKRVGYGTGPVLPESGDVNVAPTPF